MTIDNKQILHQSSAEADLAKHSEIERQESISAQVDNSDPLANTIAAAVSGGVAGAAIGRLVAGKMGSTIGAVVGGVAGVAVGTSDVGKQAAHAAGGIVEVVKDAPERVKAIAADRGDAAKEGAETALNRVVEAVKEAPEHIKAIASNKNKDFHQDFPSAQTHQNTLIQAGDFNAEVGDGPERLKEIAANKTIAPDRFTTLIDPPSEELSSQHYRFRYILPAKTHFHLGVALGRQGQLEAAIDEFEQVLNLAPDSAETYYNLAIALSKHGKVNQAIDYLHYAGQLCVQQGKARGAKVVDKTIKRIAPATAASFS